MVKEPHPETPQDGGEDGHNPVLRPAAFLASIAAWILAAGLPEQDAGARWVGTLAFHLLAALLIKWIYTRKHSPRPPLLSPALFLIAAGIALLGRLGPDRVETALQGTSVIA